MKHNIFSKNSAVGFLRRNSGILIGLFLMIAFLIITQPVFLKVFLVV